ncbi:hypothetical protein SFR_5934 [Streptomyces sp. FR-008]|nr:hypothetical protein SFR_5934 [Streptomyces sp. FR-008]
MGARHQSPGRMHGLSGPGIPHGVNCPETECP